MTYGQLKDKVQRLFTMQQNCHIFIPKNIVKMISKDIPANRRSANAVKWCIENKIMSVNTE
jgi:hypothetical protein